MTSFTHPVDDRKPADGVPFNPLPTPKTETKWIALAAIAESPFNPRKDFPVEGIAELAESIQARGLLENLVVRPLKKVGQYELMAGHRRLRALKLNKAEGCQCTVIEADDGQARATLIVENLQREDLGPMEEAEAFDALNKADPAKWTPQAIAASIGKTPRFVQQRLALKRNLAPETAKAMKDDGLKVEAARVLAGAPQSLQKKVLEGHWNPEEMTGEDVRDELALHAVPEANAAFDVKLYDGEWIDEGKKRLFADVEKFTKLQVEAGKAKAEALKKTWPTAEFVSAKQADDFVWADNGEFVRWNERKGNKATGSFKKDKATAIVWIDGSHRLKVAEGVKRQPVRSGSTHTHHAPPSYKETPERKVVRESFNRKLSEAYAKHPSAPVRLLLLEMITGDSGVNISTEILKRALPGIAMKATWMNDDEKAKIWPKIAALKDAAVLKAFQELGRGIVDIEEEYSSYGGWCDHQKRCPALFVEIGKTVGVAPEAEKATAPKPVPKKAAPTKTAKPAQKKSASKKKHQ